MCVFFFLKEAHSAKTELHDAQDALQRLGAKEHQETHDKEKLGEEYRRKMDKAKNRMKELQQKQKVNIDSLSINKNMLTKFQLPAKNTVSHTQSVTGIHGPKAVDTIGNYSKYLLA